MSEAEIAELFDGESVPVEPEVEEEIVDPLTLACKYGESTLTIVPGITLSTSAQDYKIENKSGKDVQNFQTGGSMSG